ncbi:hypothetical protein [Streptomyces uncialis]|uniref:hypothetical protein n=1 Tax=Streptomyces uncialis TaxID=1048205 RepID=UPI002F916CBF|nr:hypothetical protein OG268_36985 [Streptomyces uncialis]
MLRALTLICRACRTPVHGDHGYLWADTQEVHSAHRARLDHEKRAKATDRPLDFHDFLSVPDPACWQAHHARCDPQRDEAHYRISSGKLRSRADLLDWSAHLVGKVWVLSATDWCTVMNEARTGGHRLAVIPAALSRVL